MRSTRGHVSRAILVSTVAPVSQSTTSTIINAIVNQDLVAKIVKLITDLVSRQTHVRMVAPARQPATSKITNAIVNQVLVARIVKRTFDLVRQEILVKMEEHVSL